MSDEERKRFIKIAQDFFNKHQLTMECNIEAKEFQAFYHILLDYQKLQKENENQKENYKNLISNVSKIAMELGLEEDGTIDEIYAKIREKDKQIDLMAETIRKISIVLANYKGSYDKETINFTSNIKCIKQYFEKLSNEKGE